MTNQTYSPGMNCKCEARSAYECGCDADWTPSEVYHLRNEIVGYKAQVAGQATYIGHLLTEIADLKERVFDYEKRIAEFLK